MNFGERKVDRTMAAYVRADLALPRRART